MSTLYHGLRQFWARWRPIKGSTYDQLRQDYNEQKLLGEQQQDRIANLEATINDLKVDMIPLRAKAEEAENHRLSSQRAQADLHQLKSKYDESAQLQRNKVLAIRYRAAQVIKQIRKDNLELSKERAHLHELLEAYQNKPSKNIFARLLHRAPQPPDTHPLFDALREYPQVTPFIPRSNLHLMQLHQSTKRKTGEEIQNYPSWIRTSLRHSRC